MVKNLFNYEVPRGKVFTQKSITIPDEAMSIREIMNRFSRGIPVPNERPIYFEGDVLNPDFNQMDLTEMEDYQKQMVDRLSQMRNSVKQEKEEQKEQNKEEAESESTNLT